MNVKRNREKTTHAGSTFDSFLEEEGIRKEVEAVAIKRMLAWQIEQIPKEKKKTKQRTATLLRAR